MLKTGDRVTTVEQLDSFPTGTAIILKDRANDEAVAIKTKFGYFIDEDGERWAKTFEGYYNATFEEMLEWCEVTLLYLPNRG